jgi:hypothetical protein
MIIIIINYHGDNMQQWVNNVAQIDVRLLLLMHLSGVVLHT